MQLQNESLKKKSIQHPYYERAFTVSQSGRIEIKQINSEIKQLNKHFWFHQLSSIQFVPFFQSLQF